MVTQGACVVMQHLERGLENRKPTKERSKQSAKVVKQLAIYISSRGSTRCFGDILRMPPSEGVRIVLHRPDVSILEERPVHVRMVL